MINAPLKSFGFLDRAAAFDPFARPLGPRFKALPPLKPPQQPPDEAEKRWNRLPRSVPTVMLDYRSAILDGFVERQRTREERRRMRAEREIGEFRRREPSVLG